MTTATVTRRIRAVPLPRLSVRNVAIAVVLAGILFGAWTWLRSSSLVAVHQVQITGLAGADAAREQTALRDAALTMTTLNASTAKLEHAVANYPSVAAIHVSTHFPHGITIAVTEQIPVATADTGGTTMVLDGAGQTLSGTHVTDLPTVGSPQSRAALAVLGAAPYQFIPHIKSAVNSARHGVIVQLRNGPQLFFGSGAALAAKWRAAVAALANSATRGAAYVDVSDPGRPAAG